MSSLFERFGGRQLSNPAPATPNGNFVSQNLPAIQNDPVGIARSIGLNLPGNLASNPQEIANYLVKSGQVSQGELNQVIGMARMMGIQL